MLCYVMLGNEYLSLTAVTAQAIGWHLVGETLNFVILQYIIVSGVITKIDFMRVKTAFSLDNYSYVNNHID